MKTTNAIFLDRKDIVSMYFDHMSEYSSELIHELGIRLGEKNNEDGKYLKSSLSDIINTKYSEIATNIKDMDYHPLFSFFAKNKVSHLEILDKVVYAQNDDDSYKELADFSEKNNKEHFLSEYKYCLQCRIIELKVDIFRYSLHEVNSKRTSELEEELSVLGKHLAILTLQEE